MNFFLVSRYFAGFRGHIEPIFYFYYIANMASQTKLGRVLVSRFAPYGGGKTRHQTNEIKTHISLDIV